MDKQHPTAPGVPSPIKDLPFVPAAADTRPAVPAPLWHQATKHGLRWTQGTTDVGLIVASGGGLPHSDLDGPTVTQRISSADELRSVLALGYWVVADPPAPESPAEEPPKRRAPAPPALEEAP